MAQRRMFSKQIVETSDFYMLSPMAQLVYFHMGMVADDEGFAECFTIKQALSAADKHFTELESIGLIQPIEGKRYVYYIVDWCVNNQIRGDRKVESKYHYLLEDSQCDADEPPNTKISPLEQMLAEYRESKMATN